MLVTHSKAGILFHSLCSLHLAVFDTWYMVSSWQWRQQQTFLISLEPAGLDVLLWYHLDWVHLDRTHICIANQLVGQRGPVWSRKPPVAIIAFCSQRWWNLLKSKGLAGQLWTSKAGDTVRSLGREDPQEEEMATRSSILAWKISWTEEPVGLQSMGSQRVRHNWAHNSIKSYPGKVTPSDRSTRVKRKDIRNQMFSFHIPLCSAGGNTQSFWRATWWYVSKRSLATHLSLWLKGWGKARQRVAGKRQGRKDGGLDRKWEEVETWERILHPHALWPLWLLLRAKSVRL